MCVFALTCFYRSLCLQFSGHCTSEPFQVTIYSSEKSIRRCWAFSWPNFIHLGRKVNCLARGSSPKSWASRNAFSILDLILPDWEASRKAVDSQRPGYYLFRQPQLAPDWTFNHWYNLKRVFSEFTACAMVFHSDLGFQQDRYSKDVDCFQVCPKLSVTVRDPLYDSLNRPTGSR